MGITIYCKKTGEGIDLGYSGFDRLRCKVAELVGGEFAKHYLLLSQTEIMFMMGTEKRVRFYDEYNKKTAEIVEKEKVPVRIAIFLYQSDCKGKIGHGTCKQILNVIGDYDDDVIYGYRGRTDCVKFADFVSLLKSCVENKSDMVWM